MSNYLNLNRNTIFQLAEQTNTKNDLFNFKRNSNNSEHFEDIWKRIDSPRRHPNRAQILSELIDKNLSSF